MGLKHHTIIFVPHARARFRKLRVTNRQIGVALGLFAALVAASVFTTWTFFTNQIDRTQLERVQDENDQLRKVNHEFEASVRQLEQQLAGFESRARQLAIVAGLEQDAREEVPGVGGEELPATPSVLPSLDERTDQLTRELSAVEAGLLAQERWSAAAPTIAPVKGVLTSGFGVRTDPFTGHRASHPAIDISTQPGQPIRATGDGIVLEAGRDGGLGNAVTISHGYGLTTRYGHMRSVAVKPGQRLHRGDIIGAVGSTGRSTGYHLHYQVFEDGVAVNPLAYILDGTSPAS
ncbi:MAG: peptidoglycan DD-metalloendopeptidase family protein [Thermoanaerobaculia bacterium]